jgi:hypothetical protein
MLHAIDTEGMVYDTTLIRLENVEADNLSTVVRTAGRPVKVLAGNCIGGVQQIDNK